MKCPHCHEPIDQLDIEFDFYSRVVRMGRRSVQVNELHLTILECLIDAYPDPIPEQQLYDEVYGHRPADQLPTPNALRVAVTNLRDSLRKGKLPIEIGRLRVNSRAMDYLLWPIKDDSAQNAA